MSRPFLTARWRNLLNLTYAVPPGKLEPLCPAGVELEVRDGRSFVSLVGFDFANTRVLGVPWPGYRTFPELNLRFYVRYRGERGVVFVREFVPKRLVAWIARALYDEPYRRAPMESDRRVEPDRLTYSLAARYGGRRHRLRVETANRSPSVPAEDTDVHFFKEHTWGFGTDRRGRTVRYRVDHPKWAVYELDAVTADVDYAALYGDEWAFLNESEPFLTVFARGSDVAVYPPETLGPASEGAVPASASDSDSPESEP